MRISKVRTAVLLPPFVLNMPANSFQALAALHFLFFMVNNGFNSPLPKLTFVVTAVLSIRWLYVSYQKDIFFEHQLRAKAWQRRLRKSFKTPAELPPTRLLPS